MPQVSGFEYIKSWPGLLKLGEFVSLQYSIDTVSTLLPPHP
jgi:hypothetical protein